MVTWHDGVCSNSQIVKVRSDLFTMYNVFICLLLIFNTNEEYTSLILPDLVQDGDITISDRVNTLINKYLSGGISFQGNQSQHYLSLRRISIGDLGIINDHSLPRCRRNVGVLGGESGDMEADTSVVCDNPTSLTFHSLACSRDLLYWIVLFRLIGLILIFRILPSCQTYHILFDYQETQYRSYQLDS